MQKNVETSHSKLAHRSVLGGASKRRSNFYSYIFLAFANGWMLICRQEMATMLNLLQYYHNK